jgi:hypothetical protein
MYTHTERERERERERDRHTDTQTRTRVICTHTWAPGLDQTSSLGPAGGSRFQPPIPAACVQQDEELLIVLDDAVSGPRAPEIKCACFARARVREVEYGWEREIEEERGSKRCVLHIHLQTHPVACFRS